MGYALRRKTIIKVNKATSALWWLCVGGQIAEHLFGLDFFVTFRIKAKSK
jgi:hypothetical protein